jgi:nucleoside-diphosphate-sugar epimerase
VSANDSKKWTQQISMKILVTGATGYLGSNFIKYLLKNGPSDINISALMRTELHSWQQDEISIIKGDLTSLQEDKFCNESYDVIVHFAALMADNDELPTSAFNRVNVEGTRNLILAIKNCGVRQFIQISTVGIYGATKKAPVLEVSKYGSNLSAYETSKVNAEIICKELCLKLDIPLTILRLGLMYGEGMKYGWPDVISSIKKGQMKIIGDGKPLIQLSYVHDIIRGIYYSMGNQSTFGETINLCGDDICSISEVFNKMADLLKVPHPGKLPYRSLYLLSLGLVHFPKFLKPNKIRLITPHRIRFFKENHVYSIAKAMKFINLFPDYDLNSGLQKMISNC